MTKKWVKRKEAERIAKIEASKERIKAILDGTDWTEEDKKIFMEDVDRGLEVGVSFVLPARLFYAKEKDESFADFAVRVSEVTKQVQPYIDQIRRLRCSYERFEDSDPVMFNGDIVITDPCYIIPDSEVNNDDWEKCMYGEEMETLGISHYMTRDTIYGDWGCTVFDEDSNETYGNFCADSGTVSVLSLDEVRAYNADVEDQLEPWMATIIRDFKGTVQFVVTRHGHDDFAVEVVGRGVNKKTGQPLNFHSYQTGL